MDILTMKKEDFKKVPFRNTETNLDNFYSLVIIPTEDMHDSGYRCMDFENLFADYLGVLIYWTLTV